MSEKEGEEAMWAADISNPSSTVYIHPNTRTPTHLTQPVRQYPVNQCAALGLKSTTISETSQCHTHKADRRHPPDTTGTLTQLHFPSSSKS